MQPASSHIINTALTEQMVLPVYSFKFVSILMSCNLGDISVIQSFDLSDILYHILIPDICEVFRDYVQLRDWRVSFSSFVTRTVLSFTKWNITESTNQVMLEAIQKYCICQSPSCNNP